MNKFLLLGSTVFAVMFMAQIQSITPDGFARAMLVDLKGANGPKLKDAAAALYNASGNVVKELYKGETATMTTLYGQAEPKAMGGAQIELTEAMKTAQRDSKAENVKAAFKSLFGTSDVGNYGRQVVAKAYPDLKGDALADQAGKDVTLALKGK